MSVIYARIFVVDGATCPKNCSLTPPIIPDHPGVYAKLGFPLIAIVIPVVFYIASLDPDDELDYFLTYKSILAAVLNCCDI